MAFSHKELAVFSALAYYDVDELDSINNKFENVLIKYESDLKKDLGEEYYDTIDKLIEETKENDYTVVKAVNDKDDTGFAAFAVKDPNNEITIACRGTEGFKIISNEDSQKDVWTDLQIGLSKETNQHQKMEEFVRELDTKDCAGFHFTGHSLGGNVATHGAVYLGDPDKVKSVVTFNSPGFNTYYRTVHSNHIKGIEDKVVNYHNEGDYVSSIEVPVGEIVIVKTALPFWDYGFSHHSIKNYKFDEQGNFERVLIKRSFALFVPASLVEMTTENAWRSNLAYQYAINKITGTNGIGYRDFSNIAYELLIEQIKEVEEPQWFDVTKWACWSEFEQAFGDDASEFKVMSEEVDAYIQNLIDINDFSVSEITETFNTVYLIDNTYAEKLNSDVESLNTGVLAKLKALIASVVPNT